MSLGEYIGQLVAEDIEHFQRAAGLTTADVDRDAVVQWSNDALDSQICPDLFLADHQCRGGSGAWFHLDLTVDAPRQSFLERLTCSLRHVQLAAQSTGDARRPRLYIQTVQN